MKNFNSFSQPYSQQDDYAGFWVRLVATFIDTIITTIIIGAILYLIVANMAHRQMGDFMKNLSTIEQEVNNAQIKEKNNLSSGGQMIDSVQIKEILIKHLSVTEQEVDDLQIEETKHLSSDGKMINGVQIEKTLPINTDLISWIILIIYSVCFLTSKIQATPGKRMMNIYVATKDGEKLSVLRCIARFFASILSGSLLGIGFLMIAFTKEKTGLHDLICGTRVFYGKQ